MGSGAHHPQCVALALGGGAQPPCTQPRPGGQRPRDKMGRTRAARKDKKRRRASGRVREASFSWTLRLVSLGPPRTRFPRTARGRSGAHTRPLTPSPPAASAPRAHTQPRTGAQPHALVRDGRTPGRGRGAGGAEPATRGTGGRSPGVHLHGPRTGTRRGPGAPAAAASCAEAKTKTGVAHRGGRRGCCDHAGQGFIAEPRRGQGEGGAPTAGRG